MKLLKALSALALTFTLVNSSVIADDNISCSDCDGKLTNIIFRYDGAYPAFIEVEAKRCFLVLASSCLVASTVPPGPLAVTI